MSEEQIIITAREQFKLAQEAETRIRAEALVDLRFRAGEQWPDSIKAQRDIEQRPCLTINKLPSFIRQVTNEQRQNRPQIQIEPTEDNDVDTAEVMQGLCRHIEVSSGADQAYDTAFESAVTSGFGYFRVVTEYVRPDSFDQKITIRRIRNPFRVYFDPTCQEADYSDADFAFVTEEITHEQYKRRFPNSELGGLQDFSALGDRAPGWINQQSVRIAEYLTVEQKRGKIHLLDDEKGSVVTDEDYQLYVTDNEESNKYVRETGVGEMVRTPKILKSRTTEIRSVKWRLINGVEVLKEKDWPGQWIPIIPVLGDEIEIDGERQLVGMVRYARDPARMYNYWASAETETIALAPKVPFVAAEGQIEGYEGLWKTANVKSHAVLPYKPKSLDGTLAPPPQRQVFEPPIQAISQARLQSSDDLKATTGIFDAALGARGNETSGRAILARQQEGDTSNFHFIDNLSRAIKHCGRIIIDLIPKIYDTPRVIRIIGIDDEQKSVAVNQRTRYRGVEKILDLTTGEYDVKVSVGPSYNSQRQAAADSMMQLTQNYPNIMQIAGDLMVKNMDWPGAQEIAERMQKTLPPELASDDENEQPIPPQAKAQMGQMNKMIEALTRELNQANDQIGKKAYELDSKERIEAVKAQVELLKAQISNDSRESVELLKAETAAIRESIAALAGPATAVPQ